MIENLVTTCISTLSVCLAGQKLKFSTLDTHKRTDNYFNFWHNNHNNQNVLYVSLQKGTSTPGTVNLTGDQPGRGKVEWPLVQSRGKAIYQISHIIWTLIRYPAMTWQYKAGLPHIFHCNITMICALQLHGAIKGFKFLPLVILNL